VTVQRFKTNRSGSARTLPPAQIAEVFAELENPYRLIAQICYYCAARVGEVTTLHSDDIDLEAGAIVFRAPNTKTKKTRTALIVPELKQALQAYGYHQHGKPGYLFPSPRTCGRKAADGSQRRTISRQSVDRVLRETFDYLGITGAATHSFRRSIATTLHQSGCTLADVAAITGHASLDSLSHYLDPEPGKAQAVLAAIAKKTGSISQ
jgi:integrase/recombinase XerD